MTSLYWIPAYIRAIVTLEVVLLLLRISLSKKTTMIWVAMVCIETRTRKLKASILLFTIGLGTHVASKIAGKVHGVAKAANIRSVKILNQHGDGSTSVLMKGISEIIKNHTAGKTVVNLSLSGPKSRIIDEALSKLVRDYNIPVFASAGNAENDACYFSPSANADVFAVGASDSKDQVAPYSNTGACVDIYAPGSDILSAWIGSADSTRSLDGTR